MSDDPLPVNKTPAIYNYSCMSPLNSIGMYCN